MKYWSIVCITVLCMSCSNDDSVDSGTTDPYAAVNAKFAGTIDLEHLDNYAHQEIPAYITKDNTSANPITDKGATLGRVLFYDKELSSNRTVSCATCHQQALAFSDADVQSQGVNGLTQRHSMRLVNNRFATEVKFFWDERAPSLMAQTTMPIQDHAEMGFSGQNGDMNLDDLIARLESLDYYQELFTFVYGNDDITEQKIQQALAQFVSSIQSFDSKFDAGRALANNDRQPFPNFTMNENMGKMLFLDPPVFNNQGQRIQGGLGCAGCHRPPEFDIDPNSLNNGIIGNIDGGIDITNTRAPSLRDLVDADGNPHTAMMHTANFPTLQQVIGHYNTINLAPGNTNLDPRLRPNGVGQQLNLQGNEMASVAAFLQTLTGQNVYTDEKWSDPF